MEIIRHKIIDSTNDEAQRIISLNKNQEPKDFIIRADFQTKGRGQRGNTWNSLNSENLMFSYVFYPQNLAVLNQFLISQVVSFSIVEYLKSKNINNVSIKWPNDIYIGMHKICGILIENTVLGKNIKSCTIGIGLNVNQTIFPENLPNPISMANISKIKYNLDTEFSQIIEILQKNIQTLTVENQKEIKQNYLNNLLGLNKTLIYKSKEGIFKGNIIDVNENGYISIKNIDTNITKIYDFNEISLVKPQMFQKSQY
ncbi:MAG: biotin--[acetyl-CoA-carboxylase] ligase [Bacteroidales bacterium]|nr:biotin--[acetyl-CoA-carboxylase] ligase [Bacteroidales bacterium]